MAKIAISIPETLLQEIERSRGSTGESRSEFLRRAIRSMLRAETERERVQRYVKGYRRYPETAEEIAFIEAALALAPAVEPWEEREEDAKR
jgi:metal-responsive CopG/Arc/MetJ family transcriptional regulator